jgi:adenylosuccinate synthase
MAADVVIGLQYGDEGKGKVVDFLARNYDYVVRFHGGNNAGHTLVVNNNRIAVHALPSGILHPQVCNVIANGCVIDLDQLAKEINQHGGPSAFTGRLFVSNAAHVILPSARIVDQETGGKIGTTGKGIGPTYAAKMNRTGLRFEDILNGSMSSVYSTDTIDTVRPFITNTVKLLQMAEKSGASILLEGAQGSLLDIDHGTYPYVTSSNCTVGGALTGTGLNHKSIRKVIGVMKAYTTRVGEGPFPTEQPNEIGDKIRQIGGEFGTTTGRNRRCGWLNLTELRNACAVNGVDYLVVTKLDVLDTFEDISIEPAGVVKGWNTSTKGMRDKHKLPTNAVKYLNMATKSLNAELKYVSTSPEREDMIVL